MPDSPPITDAELVARVRAGDRSAVEHVFRTHYATLLRFAIARLGDRGVAEDVVEEVFAGLILRHESLRVHGALEGYLIGAVRNTILKQYRTERREYARREHVARDARALIDDAASDEHEVHGGDEVVLTRVIAELPERQQTIITMRWLHGAAYEDIADVLGMTVAAVKMQASRTLRGLREMLNREG